MTVTPLAVVNSCIRMAVTVVLRNHEGVRRHVMLAHEVGATWEEILGSIMLTVPGFGLLPAVEAIPHARAGYEQALAIAREHGLEAGVAPLVEVRLADLERLARESPPPSPPAA